MNLLKKGFVFLMSVLAMAGIAPATQAAALNSMAPYENMVSPHEFYNGAMLELSPRGDAGTWVRNELRTMKNEFNINTVNIYGLENFSAKDALFDELKRLGMQVVVRIESYSSTFAFQVSDLDWIFKRYSSLLDYVCASDKRGQAAYFSLNMPVDDGSVQNRLEGGINGAQSKERQVSYADAFVSRMRRETAARGFSDAPMFLSIFYGWDNSFDVPSYASAGADGYFMNNYSYPLNDRVPDETAGDADLINKNRLAKSVNKYRSQYAGKPLVMEFGFHTVEYNNGRRPNQTAGLVANRAAKARAIKATIAYYRTVPEFRGALYFGYNLYKEEGNPPAVMDWTLRYPDETPAPTTAAPGTAATAAPTATAPAPGTAKTTAGGSPSSAPGAAAESSAAASADGSDGSTTATSAGEAAATQGGQTTDGSGKKGLSLAAQLGIGAGVFLLLAALGGGGLWFYFKRCKPRRG